MLLSRLFPILFQGFNRLSADLNIRFCHPSEQNVTVSLLHGESFPQLIDTIGLLPGKL